MNTKEAGKIYLHIGFHKTGTTSLQVHVFPKLDNILYLGRYHKQSKYGEDLYLDILRYCCMSQDDLDLKHKIIVELDLLLKKTDILISDEWLSSNYDGLFYGNGANWTEKQRRLKDISSSFNTQILLCTRNPIDAAYSMYCEFKQIPYGAKYKTFQEFCEDSFDVLIYISGEDFLFNLWGKEKVTRVEYEQLKSNLIEFENSLQKYFDGRAIQHILSENHKNKNNGFTEIKKRGSLFYRIKHIIRNSTFLSKLMLDSKYGMALIKIVTTSFEKKMLVKHLTTKQKKDCLDQLLSRRLSI